MQIQISRRRARRGSAILESSFVFLGFFAMMLGSFDFAQFLFLHQAIVERTRYAARWGAINDATAGFRAYRVEALHRIDFETVRSNGYGFQVEMTYRLVRLRCRIVEFPITFVDRADGVSKISGGIVGEALLLVARLWVVDFFGRRRRRHEGY